MSMETTIQGGSVVFTQGADQFIVTLERTLRLPEDGKTHALPPSVGHFPIKRVDDYADKVPPAWNQHGGVFLPLWQREALWLHFRSTRRPFVCKVAAGKINAVSGQEWTEELAPSNGGSNNPRQDYMVCPPQPWLDGFNTGNGVINQFVAMPLGMGYTVEGQVTGKESFGGIQLMAIAPKAGLLEPKPRPYGGGVLRSKSFGPGGQSVGGGTNYSCDNINLIGEIHDAMPAAAGADDDDDSHMDSLSLCDFAPDTRKKPERRRLTKGAEMGLGKGGSMIQKIHPDPHGIDTWDMTNFGRMYIHFVNSEMYEQITGEKPPKSPISAQLYTKMGYPWYKLWDEEMGDVSASGTLSNVKTVGQMDQKHGFEGQQDDSPVYEKNVVNAGKILVKDGVW